MIAVILCQRSAGQVYYDLNDVAPGANKIAAINDLKTLLETGEPLPDA